jgi:hypothetical protein
MTWTKVETELARVVVDDLRARGWTVYQEVSTGTCACDIVAVMGRVLWAIECKVSLGLGVLAQARGWLDSANLVSVAVLPGRRTDGRALAEATAKMLGVGILEVYAPGHYDWMLRGSAIPSRRRVAYPFLRKSLHEQQQTFAPAGTATGKRFTPYAGTCAALRHVLLDGPMTIREAVAKLEGRHHYASELSARGSIYKWAELGKIEGVELLAGSKGKPARIGLVDGKRSTASTSIAVEPDPEQLGLLGKPTQ